MSQGMRIFNRQTKKGILSLKDEECGGLFSLVLTKPNGKKTRIGGLNYWSPMYLVLSDACYTPDMKAIVGDIELLVMTAKG